MAELESLVFSVDTSQLDTATKKVEQLAASVSTLEQATTYLGNSDAASTRAAADSIKAKAELTRANIALARAEEAAAKAANDSSSAIKSSTTATEASTKALAGAADNTSKIQKLLQNLSNTYGDLGNSMTRGESSIMNAARNFGASAAELEQVRSKLKDIGTLTKNPFDASLGAVRSITQELQAMQARFDPLNKDLFLTSKQLAEYSRLSAEATSKVVGMKLDPNSATGLAKVNELLSVSQQEYRKTAAELNKLVAQEYAQNVESKKLLDSQANIDKSNNDIVASTKRLSDITALVTSGMSKEEAQMRVNLAARGVTVDNIEAQIVAEKNLAAAIASKGGAIRQSTSDMVDYIAKLEDRTKRDVLAEKYISTYGTSRATANMAARAEMEKVPEDVIKSFIDRANAVDKATKASTGHANALKQVADEEARMVSALHSIAAAQGAGIDLSEKAAIAIANYEKHLKAAGIAGQEYSDKVALYTKQQQAILKNDQEQQTKYLQRALQPQATDIFMGLATGQPIMTTLMQQFGQVSDQMALAGVASSKMGEAMAAATVGMVKNLGQVVLAVGQVGVAISTKIGTAITDFTMKYSGLGAIFEFTRKQLAATGEEGFSAIGKLNRGMAVFSKLAGGLAVGLVGIASATAVAAYQTVAAQRELNTALQLQGAALGLTTEAASKYADSIEVTGVSSNRATQAFTEMVNAGIRSKESIAGITQVALELEKYGGVAIEKTANQYAALGKDPLKALAELGIETGYVTEETLKQVDALIEVGKKEEAVALATQAMQNAHNQAVSSMKEQLTPFGELLIEIKGYVNDVWQAFINLGKSSTIIDGLRTIVSSYAAAVTVLVGSVKSWVTMMAGAEDAYSKAKSGDIEGAKAAISNTKDLLNTIGDETEAKLLSIKTTSDLAGAVAKNVEAMANQRKENSDNSASFEAVRKAMKKVEDQSDKLDKKVISKPEYIKKYLEDQLKYAQAQMKTGQEVRFTTEQLKKQEEVAGRLWEKEQKKDKKGRTPREVLNKPSNVDLQENKKSYESAIRLAEEFGKNERAILKNNYEAGLVERGAYIARDLALIIAGEQQRRQAIEAETAGLTQDYEKKRIALEAEAKRLKSSTLKGAPEQYQKVERALSDLSKQQETFNVLQGDKTAKLENEINLRYSETLKESNQAMVALNKSYTDFVKKQDDLATQRKDQIASTNTLMQLTGAEAAAYKAGAESVKQMTDELSKFKNDAKEADKVFSDFIANTKPSDFDNEAFLQRYMLLLKQKQNAATKVDEAIAKSGEYVEKAKTDAVTVYYQEEVKRISEGLSGVLTTAIFDGGEAGAKALRSFIEQELRKKFMIEIQANLITPLVKDAFSFLGIPTGDTGNKAGGVSSGIQTASNLNSLWGTASQALYGGTAGASAASLVGANVVGMLGGDAIGTLAAANGMWAGVATGAQATAQAAIAANVALEAGTAVALEAGTLATAGGAAGAATAGAASSLTSAIAAIPGWGWALAGVALLAGSGVFDSGETRSGSRYETTAQGAKRIEGPSGGAINRYTEEQLNKQAFTSINSFLKNVGSKDFLTQFVSGIETSDNGKGGAFAGGTLSSGAKFGDTQSATAYQFNENLSADDAMKRYTEEMNKVTIAALQAATDVPEYIAKAIADLDVEKLTAEQADAVVKDVQEMFTALKTANKYMRDFGATLFEATEKGALSLSLLTSEFGGLEQFNSAMQTFSSLVSSPFQQALSNYTELRTAIDELGIELPYSAEGIRQLTNGLDLNTEAGRKAYASTIQAGSAMIQAGDALLETIGTSTEELAGIIVEGMRNGDPAGAGQYFADTVVYGIENALYQNMGSQITQIITNGIVTPLMQSMFAGSTAAEAISKLSIASVTKQVQEVTTFFSSLFSSSEWKSVMSSLQQGLSGLVSSTITSMPAPTFSEPVNPWKEVDKSAKDAEDAAKKAAEEWAKLLETLNDRKRTAEIKTIYLTQGKAAGVAAERAKELSELTKDLNSKQTQQITALYGAIVALEDYNATLEAVQKLQEEGKTLEIQLLRALGKEELALSKEREIAIKDMSELEIAQYDLNTSTSKLIDQVSNLNSVFKSVFDTLATPDMKATKSYQDALAGIEKETGVKMDRRYVQNFTNEELLNIAGVVSQWKDVSAETRANLVGFVGQIGELNTAFRETEKEIKSLVVTLSERFMSKRQLGASKYDTLASDIISSNLSGAEKNSLSRALQDANKQTIQDTLLDLFSTDLTQDQKKSLVEIANKLLDYLQQALDDAMSETDKAFSTLTAIADKQIAKLEKSFEVTDNAYAALERAVEAQRKGLEKQIKTAEKTRDTLKEIFDFLTEQIRELRGEVDQTKKMQADEGRRIILEARASGVLPTEKILQESVGAARTGVEDQLYATKQERDRAYLVLANDLEALKDIAGPQLTEAEKQLEIATKQLDGLDDILKKAKDQIDIMRGIDVSILSVDQAMSKLQTAIQAEQEARNQIEYIKKQIELAKAQYDTLREVNQGITDLGVALNNFATTISNEMKALADAKSILPNQSVPITTGVTGGLQGPIQPSVGAAGTVVPFTPTSTTAVSSNGTPSQTIVSNPGMGTVMYQPTAPSVPVAPSAPTNYFGSNGAEVHVASGVGYQAGTGLPYVVSEIASLASSMLASGQDQAVIAAIQGQGFTHSQAEAILGMDLPQFADGGSYQGGLALVGEEGPELINFNQPGQIFTAGQTRGLMNQDNSDLVEELQALRQEVQMLRSEARATALNTGKLDRRFDRMTAITPNGESLRTSDTPEG